MALLMLSGVPAGFLGFRTQGGSAGKSRQELRPSCSPSLHPLTCPEAKTPGEAPPPTEDMILRFCGRRGSVRRVEAQRRPGPLATCPDGAQSCPCGARARRTQVCPEPLSRAHPGPLADAAGGPEASRTPCPPQRGGAEPAYRFRRWPAGPDKLGLASTFHDPAPCQKPVCVIWHRGWPVADASINVGIEGAVLL